MTIELANTASIHFSEISHYTAPPISCYTASFEQVNNRIPDFRWLIARIPNIWQVIDRSWGYVTPRKSSTMSTVWINIVDLFAPSVKRQYEAMCHFVIVSPSIPIWHLKNGCFFHFEIRCENTWQYPSVISAIAADELY